MILATWDGIGDVRRRSDDESNSHVFRTKCLVIHLKLITSPHLTLAKSYYSSLNVNSHNFCCGPDPKCSKFKIIYNEKCVV